MKLHIGNLFRLPVLVLSLLIVVGASPALANLVQDGSFELLQGTNYYRTGLMGPWTVSVSGDRVGIYPVDSFMGANVTDGNQAFDLGMGGTASGNSLSQVLPTLVGRTYRLSFDWGSEYAMGTSAFVSVGDLRENLDDSERNWGDYSTPWIVYSSSFLFIASGNDRLMFRQPAGSDYWGLALDNISVEPVDPQLTLIPSGPNVILSWPTDATGFTLQSTTNLVSPVWDAVPTAPVVVNGQNTVTNPISGKQQFFRLSK